MKGLRVQRNAPSAPLGGKFCLPSRWSGTPSGVARFRIVPGDEDDEDDSGEQDSFFDVYRCAVEFVEVDAVGIVGRDGVDGSAGSDAVLLHAGNDRELRIRGEREHDERDADGRGDGARHGFERLRCEQENNDDGAGEESFVMEDAQAFGDDGSGGVRVRDGAECAGGDDGKEEDSAEPEDDEEEDDCADGRSHVASRQQGIGDRQ